MPHSNLRQGLIVATSEGSEIRYSELESSARTRHILGRSKFKWDAVGQERSHYLENLGDVGAEVHRVRDGRSAQAVSELTRTLRHPVIVGSTLVSKIVDGECARPPVYCNSLPVQSDRQFESW